MDQYAIQIPAHFCVQFNKQIHPLGINAIVYTELSLVFSRYEDLDKAIADLGLIILDISRAALFLPGRAFLQY